MFCPNCGKASADEKFCSNCGQEISPVEEIAAVDFPEPPIGRYEGIDGYIDLSFFTLTIHKEILGNSVEHTVAYHDIADVVFHKASDEGKGFLAIRERKESYLPVENELDASCDEKTLVFSKKDNREFGEIFMYLQTARDNSADANLKREGAQSLQSRSNENNQGVVCPKCKSDMYRTCYIYPHHPYQHCRVNNIDSCVLLKIVALVVEIYSFLQRRRVAYVCQKCGFKWTI